MLFRSHFDTPRAIEAASGLFLDAVINFRLGERDGACCKLDVAALRRRGLDGIKPRFGADVIIAGGVLLIGHLWEDAGARHGRAGPKDSWMFLNELYRSRLALRARSMTVSKVCSHASFARRIAITLAPRTVLNVCSSSSLSISTFQG